MSCGSCDAGEDYPIHGGDIELAAVEKPHGLTRYSNDKCRCNVCREAASAYSRDRRRRLAYGRVTLVDAEPVRQHIARLREFGIGWRRVAELAGMEPRTVWRLIYGDRRSGLTKRVRPSTEQRILAVEAVLDNVADGAPVPAFGARRRLQALVALGWSQRKLGDPLGISGSNMAAVMHSERLSAATVRAVHQLYEELWNKRPLEITQWDKMAAARARNFARANGWPPPMAWDDDTIDDPDAVPEGAATDRVNQRNKLPAADDLRFLLEGESKQRVAARFGVKPSSIDSALARAS